MRDLINICEGATITGSQWFRNDKWSIGDVEFLHHGTSSELLNPIIENGLRAPSHWGSYEAASFFARGTCIDHGGQPVLFRIALKEFHEAFLRPDENMIDFPIFTNATARWDEWQKSSETWKDSLRIYEAVVYDFGINLDLDDLLNQ